MDVSTSHEIMGGPVAIGRTASAMTHQPLQVRMGAHHAAADSTNDPESGIDEPEKVEPEMLEPKKVYLTSAALAHTPGTNAVAAQAHPLLTSLDDRANACQRPLSKQDDQANLPDGGFMVNDLLHFETVSGMNTSGTYSNPEPIGKAQRAENCAVAIPVQKLEGHTFAPTPQRGNLEVFTPFR